MRDSVIFKTSDLKSRAPAILKAARRRPQFVIREGTLYQITVVNLPVSGASENPPPGFYADAYPLPADRRALETAAGRVSQIAERE